ncbi:DUF427 domain-containing protein [Roseospira visakhapatnamensis]|uniref:Uncharacterized protein (DUF427 family) n=1 Tax=Roseospira visakhapatnamensis TaxID=390880 RepID=A0A7W6W9B1_9PROT|nr:DUF427 domain-containing protein [Roseospira visakhapatnamensis]MBB4265638.1 uncharacterized protein (DUF427 family) [Roseospira visakhapatnamensis]
MISSHRRVVPGPGQESVWDYPRPPRLEPVADRLRVLFAGETVAETTRGWRLLETSHPPVYYIPRADVRVDRLEPSDRRTVCEFKGTATYWTLMAGNRRSRDAAWSYPDPPPALADLRDALAFYANRVDACFVGDDPVHPQAGDFYGGWITARVVGPFKGAPGTWGW